MRRFSDRCHDLLTRDERRALAVYLVGYRRHDALVSRACQKLLTDPEAARLYKVLTGSFTTCSAPAEMVSWHRIGGNYEPTR